MKKIWKLIREIIPVIIGILIALVINNWNENRKDKKYLNKVYASIKAELEESNKDIEKSLPRQQVLIDSLTKYMNDNSTSIYQIIDKANGLSGPNIKMRTWNAITNSNIELIEFEKLSALSEIEDSKKNLELKQQKILDFIIENIKTTNLEEKEVFMLLIQEIISTEEYLRFEIEEFLKK